MLGDEADSLLLIECLPALETRNYVEKVMAGYWTYREDVGRRTRRRWTPWPRGARFIDARLDLDQPLGAPAQLSAQPLQVGMR